MASTSNKLMMMRAARPRGFDRGAARFEFWLVELAVFFFFRRVLMCFSPLGARVLVGFR
jgi:hypothetical protein